MNRRSFINRIGQLTAGALAGSVIGHLGFGKVDDRYLDFPYMSLHMSPMSDRDWLLREIRSVYNGEVLQMANGSTIEIRPYLVSRKWITELYPDINETIEWCDEEWDL